MNELFISLDPSGFAIPMMVLGLGSFLKKAVKSIGNVGQKIIDVHKKVAKEVEQAARPITKMAAVAAATYYGGPQAGQMVAGYAYRDKSPPASVGYTEYSGPYVDSAPYGVVGQVYPQTYPGYSGTVEGSGAALSSFGTADGSYQAPTTFPPWLIFAGAGGVILVLILAMTRR